MKKLPLKVDRTDKTSVVIETVRREEVPLSRFMELIYEYTYETMGMEPDTPSTEDELLLLLEEVIASFEHESLTPARLLGDMELLYGEIKQLSIGLKESE